MIRKLASFVLILWLSSVRLFSAGIPAPVENVSDYANLLTPGQIAEIESLVQKIRKTGYALAVVTIPTAGTRTVKQYATEAFNSWGVGDQGSDNGILVVLSTGERRIEVETGYSTEAILPDFRVGRILDDYAVPFFKNNQWAKGLIGLAEGIHNHLSTQADRRTYIPGKSSRGPKRKPVSGHYLRKVNSIKPHQQKSGFDWIFWTLFGGGLLVMLGGGISFGVSAIYFIWAMYHPMSHTFIKPKVFIPISAMLLLIYLPFVFQGDPNSTHLYEFLAIIVGFTGGLYTLSRSCPRCKVGYLNSISRTLRSATYVSSGKGETTTTCPRCNYHNVSTYTIPRRTHSTSSSSSSSSWSSSSSSSSYSSSSYSSSSSFGGGSSGGGGAGRSF